MTMSHQRLWAHFSQTELLTQSMPHSPAGLNIKIATYHAQKRIRFREIYIQNQNFMRPSNFFTPSKNFHYSPKIKKSGCKQNMNGQVWDYTGRLCDHSIQECCKFQCK